MRNELQILGDGKEFVIIFNQENNQQLALDCKSVYAESISVDHQTDIDTSILGNGMYIYQPSLVKITVELLVPADKLKYMSSENKDLFFNLDMFRNTTVKSLFKEINKKIDRRK